MQDERQMDLSGHNLISNISKDNNARLWLIAKSNLKPHLWRMSVKGQPERAHWNYYKRANIFKKYQVL